MTMTIQFDFFTAQNLAVFCLSFFAGLILAFFIKSRGILGCISSIFIGALITILVVALIRGYNTIIEDITYHFTMYILYNTIGFIGIVAGFITGLLIKKNK